jgi:hypothetical protein
VYPAQRQPARAEAPEMLERLINEAQIEGIEPRRSPQMPLEARGYSFHSCRFRQSGAAKTQSLGAWRIGDPPLEAHCHRWN